MKNMSNMTHNQQTAMLTELQRRLFQVCDDMEIEDPGIILILIQKTDDNGSVSRFTTNLARGDDVIWTMTNTIGQVRKVQAASN